MRHCHLIAILILACLALVGCGSDRGSTEAQFAADNDQGQTEAQLAADDSEEIMLQDLPPGPDDSSDSSTAYGDGVSNILFAHGYQDDSLSWDSFTNYIQTEEDYNTAWTVYRTTVTPDASIEDRASELADYISALDAVEEDSLIAVGHSMGGLDLRYIVTEGNANQDDENNKYYLAAQKIHKVFTIASPHGGNLFGGAPKDDGAVSLGIEQMRAFNIDHPYHDFNVDERDIPMLAFRFHCGDKISSSGNGAIEPESDSDGDGTVALKRQILFGAPFTQTIFHGRHTTNFPNMCSTEDVELEQIDPILEGILDNTAYYTDVKDIVFYEHFNCEGDEKGAFSSKHKNGVVSCKDENICDEDEFSSLKIYPSIRPNTTIKLYDSPSRHLSDDWTRIHIGDTPFTEPFCINGFEHDTIGDEEDQGITVVHHHDNGINGKVSALNIFYSTNPNDPLDIIFYEKDDCSGNIAGAFKSTTTYRTNCRESDRCHNDQASSVMIYPSASKSADIYLYNDPNGDKDYAWAHINLTGSDFDDPVCVSGFEQDKHYSFGIEITSHEQESFGINAGLTGNVSRITILE